ncbi:MAG: hypothetical protein ACYC6Y_30445, partial [Thermoguttaceae bacterium]
CPARNGPFAPDPPTRSPAPFSCAGPRRVYNRLHPDAPSRFAPTQPHRNNPMNSPASLLVAAFLGSIALASQGPLRAADNNEPSPFVTDALGAPPAGGPLVEPWRTVDLHPEYSGQWVVLGDVDGDRAVEVVSARNVDQNDNHFTSAVVAQTLDSRVLWTWGDPTIGRRKLHHDVACQVYDLDGNGTNEVVLAADRELVVLDGKTGKPLRSFPIPEHASDCVAFADLSGSGRRTEILVKNRYRQIWAYTLQGRLLSTADMPGGYRTAHQPYPLDLDGDGRDEILAGYAALNSDGSVRWVFRAEQGKPNGGHADCWRIVRLAPKADDTRLAMTMCGGNALVMTDGNGRLVWQRTGSHYESIDVGEIRKDRPGLEIAVDVDHLPQPPMPLCLFDENGNELGRINTDSTRHHKLVDWNGDGEMEMGSGLPCGLFDGRGRRVATFRIDAGQEPWQLTAADLAGHGLRDVMLLTTGEKVDKVYLYLNPTPASTPAGVPAGTGPNFTLY